MKTISESLETLRLQVEYLKEGFNPVVFFPPDTKVIPKLPQGFKELRNEKGLFYFNPQLLTKGIIEEASEKGTLWLLLGFVQDKKEAIKEKPVAIVARDSKRTEIKTAVVGSNDEKLASLQAYIFYQWFPGCTVSAEPVFNVIAERLNEVQNAAGNE